MRLKLVPALLLAAPTLWPVALHAQDATGTSDSERIRAADLMRCCTPGDQDFPKVGGNLGNQNYTRLRQINKGLLRAGNVFPTTVEKANASGFAP